jgi:6-pyruvoyl-tetrahydropterin synthase
MTMRYHRNFILQCCHFNGTGTYDAFDSAMNAVEPTDAIAQLLTVLKDLHGHNFLVEVAVEWEDEDLYLLDEALSEVVLKRDNTNLSIDPSLNPTAFTASKSVRVTTERFAAVLADEVYALACQNLGTRCRVEMRIAETPTIEVFVQRGVPA